MRHFFTLALLGVGLVAFTAPAPSEAVPARAGKQTGRATSHVNKPASKAMGNQKRAGANAMQNSNRPGNNGPKGKRGNNNVVAGNTVVVGGQPGRGYYDNGSYRGRPDWDDDDNDFLEFVGKTAAVTAGVSIVAAVIGDVSKDKPDNCEPINVGGQPYLNCNGVAYQQVQSGYQVVAPPPGMVMAAPQ
jgi:hypothetical protein